MKKINIIIERNSDGFWAHAETAFGISGGGDTLQECKKDVLACIEILKTLDDKYKIEYADNSFELVYKFI